MSEIRAVEDVIRDFEAGKISHDCYKELITNYNEAIEAGKSKKERRAEADQIEAQPELVQLESILTELPQAARIG